MQLALAALRRGTRWRGHLWLRQLVSRATPNPRAKMFQNEDLRNIIGVETSPLSFSRPKTNAKHWRHRQVLTALFRIEAVQSVMFGQDYATVVLDGEAAWEELEGRVEECLAPLFNPDFNDDVDAGDGSTLEGEKEQDEAEGDEEEEDEVVSLIKDLIEERVRPYAQGDGGDIIYDRFDRETGVLWLHMLGACASCPSSTVTLRYNVNRLLTHYVPEVKEVKRSDIDDLEESSVTQFDEEWTGEVGPRVRR